MSFHRKKSKGFTLLELLIVVGIIGMLSAIVISAVGTARKRGQDTAIRQEAMQMRTSLELEFNQAGSYGGGMTYLNWINTTGGLTTNGNDCNYSGYFTSATYGAQMRQICDRIIKTETGSVNNMIIWPAQSDLSNWNKYTIMVRLPSNGLYYCLGSNGKSTMNSDPVNGVAGVPPTVPGTGYYAPGCYQDPTL